MAGYNLHRLLAVRCRQHGVAASRKRRTSEFQYICAVFNKKDGFSAAGRRSGAGGGAVGGRSLAARQINLETRAVANLAINLDMPAALLDDAVNRRQAKPGALADFLGRKKRFKNARFGF